MREQLNFDFMTEAPQDKPHHNQDRVLTVLLKITDPTKAEEWLWSMKNNPELGVQICGLSNGDMFMREQLLEKTLSDLDSIFGDETDLIEDAFNKLDKMVISEGK